MSDQTNQPHPSNQVGPPEVSSPPDRPSDVDGTAPKIPGEPRTGATSTRPFGPAPATDALLAGMRNPDQQPNGPEPVFIDEQELSRRTTLSRTTLQTMRSKGGARL